MLKWTTPRSPFGTGRTTRLRFLAVICGGAIALSVFGFEATPALAKSKTTVAAAKVSGVGTVMVDSKGRTLYTLTNGGQPVACTGQCAEFWPPLVVAAGSNPKGAKGVTGLGLVQGGQQVTAQALPLYRYSGDTKKGEANGEGLSSFGGVWHVVKGSGSGSSSSGNSSSSGGSGY